MHKLLFHCKLKALTLKSNLLRPCAMSGYQFNKKNSYLSSLSVITSAGLALIVLRSSVCWISQQLDNRSVVKPTWLPWKPVCGAMRGWKNSCRKNKVERRRCSRGYRSGQLPASSRRCSAPSEILVYSTNPLSTASHQILHQAWLEVERVWGSGSKARVIDWAQCEQAQLKAWHRRYSLPLLWYDWACPDLL